MKSRGSDKDEQDKIVSHNILKSVTSNSISHSQQTSWNYKLKRMRKSSNWIRGIVSKEMLKNFRSPRYIEKENMEKSKEKRSKYIQKEYFKILHKKSRTRASTKNLKMIQRSSSRNKEELLAK